MPSVSPLLSIDDLHFSHPHTPVFSGFHARIGGGLVLVCGDESTGKTTLLRLLAGDVAPQRGRFTLLGASAVSAPEAYRAQVFHADPRSDTLDPWTAQAWLDAQARRYPGWDAEALALHIQGFALAEHLDKTFYALSTGTRRKVCVAAGGGAHGGSTRQQTAVGAALDQLVSASVADHTPPLSIPARAEPPSSAIRDIFFCAVRTRSRTL